MTKQRIACMILLGLCLSGQTMAQEYQLGWDEVNLSERNKKSYTLGWTSVDRHVDRAEPKPVMVASPPTIWKKQPAPTPPQAAVRPRPQPRPIPTYDISLAAGQFYDHYEERYKVVKAIEVATFRAGSLNCETFENIGECTEYEVYLEDLKPGDSYQARIIWDDGSNRTIENTIGECVKRRVYVDEPDFLAYSAW